MEDMETSMTREPDTRHISESEEATTSEEEEEEETTKERLIRVVTKVGAKPKVEVPMYEGNLNVEEQIDRINALDKYFDYEDVDEEKKVKYAGTRLKGHAALWWDELQVDRSRKGESKIRNWDSMIAKFKTSFDPQTNPKK
jgi:hypothetical protein